jgi:transposase
MKKNRDKTVDRKLNVLKMHYEGYKRAEISKKTDYKPQRITELVHIFLENGIEKIIGNNYKANRRNMTFEEESAFLAEFSEKSEKGQMVDVREIKAKYEEKVGHKIGNGQIYRVLKRHNWRKIKPRSRHPKKASPEAIEASKKLTPLSGKI